MGNNRPLRAAAFAALTLAAPAAHAEASESTAVMSVGRHGFSRKSADSKNEFRFRGVMHVEGRYFDGEDPGGVTDTWEATRIRPGSRAPSAASSISSSCRITARTGR
jgi:hypothetical protein